MYMEYIEFSDLNSTERFFFSTNEKQDYKTCCLESCYISINTVTIGLVKEFTWFVPLRWI